MSSNSMPVSLQWIATHRTDERHPMFCGGSLGTDGENKHWWCPVHPRMQWKVMVILHNAIGWFAVSDSYTVLEV